jgi:cytidylate kinase
VTQATRGSLNPMGARVICISRTLAAGGETVGELVAKHLGFSYVDEQIITLAAREAQVDPKLVSAAEQRQPVLQRLLEKLPTVSGLAGAVTVATGIPVDAFAGAASGSRSTPEEMRLLIRAAIHAVARSSRAVIVAHAASMALSGSEGILRVLVTAPVEIRVQRLVAGGVAATEAEASIAASDLGRRDYLGRFYGVKQERATHYDMVLNTEVLGAERAASAIVAAARVS